MVLVLVLIMTLFLVGSSLFLKQHFIVHPLPPLSLGVVFDIIWTMLKSVYAWGALLSMGVGTCLWVYIINKAELSKVYPMVSLAYVVMLFADRLVFGNPITLTKMAGVACVCVGVVLLSR